MLKRKKKAIACMVYLKAEKGFTFLNMLLALSLLLLLLPLPFELVKVGKYTSNDMELSLQQFTHFLMEDSLAAVGYKVDPTSVSLQFSDGKIAVISQYKNQIRRQVDGEGHEIYLRDIKKVQFSPLPYGYHVSVTSDKGDSYEKTIPFYNH
ncbi:competence type IV pilus minor pilin ComGF [Virgibacillus halodenitrificans]|uniref:competence type IV pilus minor pilin ComGF n=1 Tax=Virgibacillus halodenitrificans TaxID=1482 RepID=UPI0009DA0ABB|nr:ComGF family competence protein [Virgibacillus halodenitrificans]